jgi:hypothetical protein
MSPTEFQLLAIHKGPVPLDEICERYLRLSREEAMRQAALNQLPFPTFRLSPSRKAPILVHLSDLANHIDTSRESAKSAWEHSQV